MDIGKFLHLIATKTMYFAVRSELSDPWEAAHPHSLSRSLSDIFGEQECEEIRGCYEMMSAQAAVSCWHENDSESIAMWSLYTSGCEGVAIRTTTGRLKKSLECNHRSIEMKRVQYLDYVQDQIVVGASGPINTLDPLFWKRRSYEHEREVRALIPCPDEPALQKFLANPNSKLGDRLLVPKGGKDAGFPLAVDLAILIERIVTSPRYPSWAVRALQEVTKMFGVQVKIECSDLLGLPTSKPFVP